jgi:RNA polymerase sigma-70 factor, ECF subfamily
MSKIPQPRLCSPIRRRIRSSRCSRRWAPDERAAFVLRELFGFNYGEIASAVGKSESAARQIAHRAHEHVQTRRQRFEPVDLRRRAEITAQFFGAAPTGDVQTLMTMLAHGAKNSSG